MPCGNTPIQSKKLANRRLAEEKEAFLTKTARGFLHVDEKQRGSSGCRPTVAGVRNGCNVTDETVWSELVSLFFFQLFQLAPERDAAHAERLRGCGFVAARRFQRGADAVEIVNRQ